MYWLRGVRKGKKIPSLHGLKTYRASDVLCFYLFIYLSRFKSFPFCGTNLWSSRINPSLPGRRLTFRSRGLGQHSRTASTHNKHTQLATLFTHALTLSTMGINDVTEWKRTVCSWIGSKMYRVRVNMCENVPCRVPHDERQ